MMDDQQIRQVITAALADGWADMPPLGHDNAPPPAAGEAGWLGLSVDVTEWRVVAMGSDGPVEQAVGQVRVDGYLPLDEGQGAADAIAANVRGQLAQRRLEGGIRLGALARRDQGRRGGWWRVLLVIPFVVDGE